MLGKKIFDIIEVAKDDSKVSILYDRFMMVVIVISLVPLFFKESHFLLTLIEVVTVIIFVIDYILRWITADFHDKNPKGILSFIKYPFTAWAIIDILAILPSLTMLNGSFRIFKLFRLWRALNFAVFQKLFTDTERNQARKKTITRCLQSDNWVYHIVGINHVFRRT